MSVMPRVPRWKAWAGPLRPMNSAEAFLEGYRPGGRACLVLDAVLPGIGGIELLRRLRTGGDPIPVLIVTGKSDVGMAVAAMKAGARDFIEKPFGIDTLNSAIELAFQQPPALTERRRKAAERLATLTPRQREVLDRVLAGHPSKNIAVDLGISRRTVENHRAAVMERTGVASLPDLARLAFSAGWRGMDDANS